MSYPGAPPPHPPPPQMLYQPHVAPQMPPHLPPPPTAQAVAGVAVPPPSSASAASSFASVMRSAATASFGAGGAGGNVGGGQSLTDRVNAARYALAGQGLARVVCKATTEEVLPPKKKHLDYLLQCTHEPNVSIPSLANLLIERAVAPSSSWVVVLKAITSMHHLMCYGNDRFSAYLASAPDVGLQSLSIAWTDRTNTAGGAEMAPFVRRYTAYLLARISSYRSVGYDFAKVKRAAPAAAPTPARPQRPQSTTGPPVIQDLSLDQVMAITPLIQTQIDALLAFDARSASDLRNAVIRGSFLLLFRDLVRLFACYNDCIICLLQKFFSISDRRVARSGLALYVSFTERMERVAGFLRVAEAIGVEKGEIPDLARAPATLLNALEAHCYVLEGKDPTEILDRPVPQPPAPPPPAVAPVVASGPPPPRPPPAPAFNPFLVSEADPVIAAPVVAAPEAVVTRAPGPPPPPPPPPAVNPYEAAIAAAAGMQAVPAPQASGSVTEQPPVAAVAPEATESFSSSNPFA